MPIMIVSNDQLFRNGASSDEGKAAHIEAVENESDLDQRLNQRPQHIQAVVDQVFIFSESLRAHGIDLASGSVTGIEELRKFNGADGSQVQKFKLRTDAISGVPPLAAATMIAFGGVPLSLTLALDGSTLELRRSLQELKPEEVHELRSSYMRDVSYTAQTAQILKAIIGS